MEAQDTSQTDLIKGGSKRLRSKKTSRSRIIAEDQEQVRI